MNELVNKIYNEYMEIMRPLIGDEVTYSNQLHKIGKKLFGSRFIGVFPSDKLPKINHRESYIANLDKSNEGGSHWIGVYNKNGNIYVYDSFGRDSKKIIPSIFKKGGEIKDSEYDAEQERDEDNCGLRSFVALYMFDTFDPDIIVKYL